MSYSLLIHTGVIAILSWIGYSKMLKVKSDDRKVLNYPQFDLLKREWVKKSGGVTGDVAVSFLQFNMLSSELEDAFPEADPVIIPWETYRKERVLQVLLENDTDVIAVEECDQYVSYLEHQMDIRGYDSVWQSKQSSLNDGAAIFWKRDLFDLEFSQSSVLGEGHSQIIIFALLNHRDSNISIFVGATHLKAKPGFEEYRKAQAECIVELFNQLNTSGHPEVLLGDFNDIPSSPMFEVLNNHFKCATQIDSWTTCKKRETLIQRTIDYIWFYSPSSNLRSTKSTIHSVLSIPPNSEIPQHLPAHYYPSDHLAIGAHLLFPPK